MIELFSVFLIPLFWAVELGRLLLVVLTVTIWCILPLFNLLFLSSFILEEVIIIVVPLLYEVKLSFFVDLYVKDLYGFFSPNLNKVLFLFIFSLLLLYLYPINLAGVFNLVLYVLLLRFFCWGFIAFILLLDKYKCFCISYLLFVITFCPDFEISFLFGVLNLLVLLISLILFELLLIVLFSFEAT